MKIGTVLICGALFAAAGAAFLVGAFWWGSFGPGRAPGAGKD